MFACGSLTVHSDLRSQCFGTHRAPNPEHLFIVFICDFTVWEFVRGCPGLLMCICVQPPPTLLITRIYSLYIFCSYVGRFSHQLDVVGEKKNRHPELLILEAQGLSLAQGGETVYQQIHGCHKNQ